MPFLANEHDGGAIEDRVAAVVEESQALRSSVLSELERSVVHLSRVDTLSSLTDRTSWTSRLRRWSGAREINRLADPRLEALRRFAVKLRVSERPTKGEVDLVTQAGFGAEQQSQVENIVAPWRSRSRSRLNYSGLCILILAAGLTYRWTAEGVADPMIALIAAGLASVLLAPLCLARTRVNNIDARRGGGTRDER